ncbi:potassium transporter KtrA [Streptomyces eurocidicus]|uniref:Potassium-transporting ATPase KdpC subunit n=1 Tax=Streptomyces eurocidicus TaxID=66423 RepID=A0A2N8NUI3_STREU|nr:potassium-transporting ATPase subunit KdpC [Streptomyces eurocidicus]MBB5120294.1 K+-transporting ATPase ATPase C chain [Streptomyces eurocidicus]MBF6056029.1 potassium-transporting ATPase subunit KdpC [Streptomyces eurocidicus]PNE32431.1 potassium transporter KtrA [Streptomyces eurocidicus]
MSPHLPSTLRQHLSALRMLLTLTVVTGIAYPLAVTGVGQLAFEHQADGSLVEDHGTPVASSLLGQNFALPKKNPDDASEALRPAPEWFQPRPSAADAGKGAGPYDPTSSGASNLGPNNPRLVTTIAERRAAVAAFDGVGPASVPADALTASGSGLDPDISPAYAYQQVNRVAKTRGLPAGRVRKLVTDHLRGRDLGFLGQERVNVIELNHDLGRLG